jgi:hypothetical protein
MAEEDALFSFVFFCLYISSHCPSFFLMKKAAQFCNNSGCSFIRENKIQIKRSQANFFKTLIVQYKRKGENGDGNKHRSQKSCDMTPFKVFCP